jgi:PKD repeat protein
VSEPQVSHGVVAWSADATGYCAVYDPGRGWVVEGVLTPAQIGIVKTAEGLVAFVSGAATVTWRCYDPMAGAWRGETVPGPGAPSVNDLTVADGLLAWSVNTVVYCRTYDQGRGTVAAVAVPVAAGYVPDLRINNGAVLWTDGLTPQTRGYNRTNAAWYSGPTLPYAHFYAYPTNGNPPLMVWYADLSLGATSRSWDFGDGTTAAQRTPLHIFNGWRRFTNSLTVAGPAGTHTAQHFIWTDTQPPSGTLLINSGQAYTPSVEVTLSLTATDNSGEVAGMRFSNDGTTWSPWEPFQTSKSWTLTPGDGLKTVYAQLKDPAENVSAALTASIRLDTRPPPVVSFSTTNFVVPESAGSITITAVLSASSVFTAAVDYATADGTATAGLDYASASGRLVFSPGQTMHTFTLWLTNDTLPELNETILLSFSNPTNCVVSNGAQVTIVDDDPPSVAFATERFNANEAAGQAIITVLLNAASGRTVTVHYATADGTGRAGADYVATTGLLSFQPGQTVRSFAVPLLDDLMDEPDETVHLRLFDPTNAVLGSLTNAVLSIVDDDPPTASFVSRLFFTNESAGSALVTVRLSSAYPQTVYVDYLVLNGTALAGSDFLAASGTLTFPPGTTNKSFVVNLIPDAVPEPIETVRLLLNNFVVCTPGPVTQAELWIVDAASAPWLFAPVQLPDRSVQVGLLGPVGRYYAIEGSGQLTTWTELGRLTNTGLTSAFQDRSATNQPMRFYRARQVD